MSRLSVSSSRQSLQLGGEDLGPNAIGSLVEATEGYRPPTIKDIEQVKLPSIARVSQQKYNEYLQEVQTEYRQYCQLKRGGSDIPGDVNSSLDSVPQAFFESDFRLDNQRIFDTVTEHKTDVATYNILQEKLSYYIDTVEVNLIEEISKSSDSFFTAIDELKQIHSDTESAVEVVRDLRTQMQTLDQIHVERGLQMVKLQQQYAQVEELENGVAQLQEIVRLFQEAERLSEEQPQTNLLPCLELVDSTDALIHGDSEYLASTTVKMSTPIANLSPLMGLKPLRDSLLSLRVKVGHKIGKQFTLLLIDDLQSHGQAVPTGDTIVRLMQQFNRQRNRASPPEAVNTSFNDVDPAFRGKLASLLNQLLRAGQVQDAFKAYQDAIADYSRRLIKQHLPSSTDTNSMSSGLSGVSGISSGSGTSRSERGMALAGKLRALSAPEFENTLAEIYASLSEFVRRLLAHQKLLLDLISSQPALLEQCGELAFGLRQVISGTVDKQLAYMTKIVNSRREQTAQLPRDLFLNFYALNGIFVRECEQSVGVVSNPLQTTLVGHLKQFIQTLFNRADEHLLAELEKDKWKDTEISAVTQQKVDDIVASATQDPAKWRELLFANLMGASTNNNDAPKEGKMRPKNVFVEAASFIIPNGTTHLVDGLVDFLQLVPIFPGQTPELVDVITSLIKRYNVSANELILQAGATRSVAKLAHISAKNLALVSQSLGFIVALIPYMRECCRRHVTSQQIPAQFDRTKRDLLKHQDDIHTKLVSIMVERMINHSRTLRRIDWSKPVTTPNGVHEYMQQLISDTNTLSKSLKKVLASENYILIMSQVVDNYKSKLLEDYGNAHIKTQVEKNNMLADAQFFSERIALIDGSGNAGTSVLEYVRSIEIVVPKAPAPTPTPPPAPAEPAEEFFSADINSDGEHEDTPPAKPKEAPKDAAKEAAKDAINRAMAAERESSRSRSPVKRVKEEKKEEKEEKKEAPVPVLAPETKEEEKEPVKEAPVVEATKEVSKDEVKETPVAKADTEVNDKESKPEVPPKDEPKVEEAKEVKEEVKAVEETKPEVAKEEVKEAEVKEAETKKAEVEKPKETEPVKEAEPVKETESEVKETEPEVKKAEPVKEDAKKPEVKEEKPMEEVKAPAEKVVEPAEDEAEVLFVAEEEPEEEPTKEEPKEEPKVEVAVPKEEVVAEEAKEEPKEAVKEVKTEPEAKSEPEATKVEEKVETTEPAAAEETKEPEPAAAEKEPSAESQLEDVNSEKDVKENGKVEDKVEDKADEKVEEANKAESKPESDNNDTPTTPKLDGANDKDDSAPTLNPEPKPASTASPKKKKNKKKGKKK